MQEAFFGPDEALWRASEADPSPPAGRCKHWNSLPVASARFGDSEVTWTPGQGQQRARGDERGLGRARRGISSCRTYAVEHSLSRIIRWGVALGGGLALRTTVNGTERRTRACSRLSSTERATGTETGGRPADGTGSKGQQGETRPSDKRPRQDSSGFPSGPGKSVHR